MSKPKLAHLVRKDFVYRSAVETDLRATFARIRREQAAQAKAGSPAVAGTVVTLKGRDRSQS